MPAVSEPPVDCVAERLDGITGKRYVSVYWPSVASSTSCWISFAAGRLRPVSAVEVSSAEPSADPAVSTTFSVSTVPAPLRSCVGSVPSSAIAVPPAVPWKWMR